MELKGGTLRLRELFAGDKKVRLIVAVGILGMVLILLSQFLDSPKEKKVASDETAVGSEEYTSQMEQKLGTLISGVEGVGKAKVMITLESSAQMIYATEEKTQNDQMQDVSGEGKQKTQQSDNRQTSYILVDKGSGSKQPLVTTRLEPTVKGVVVVCPGADSQVVRARVVDVVTTALGIGSNKVCVVKYGG
ncbi:MAG: stage III sporulation protein AG [Clostridiales bacterium]|uniref:Stage III sporulation protein AG n=1 Tax=Harryflintia acetispora TaxID=1849041 RepID=A0A9X8UJK9_9FIRM|nr:MULTISPECIES: hypothetical protein [Oscillospiraceae]PWM41006.1 MAG: stage III sporulation protein AG [Clostridiales bacterium]RGB66480.1 stage III sporulation protein AG [Harryflintia acetispora]TCL43537.1 stage III sporulation protein AG [Harryflintia acetispora]